MCKGFFQGPVGILHKPLLLCLFLLFTLKKMHSQEKRIPFHPLDIIVRKNKLNFNRLIHLYNAALYKWYLYVYKYKKHIYIYIYIVLYPPPISPYPISIELYNPLI